MPKISFFPSSFGRKVLNWFQIQLNPTKNFLSLNLELKMILNVYISNSPNLFMTRELVVLLQKNGRAIKNAQREMNIAFEWF